MQEPDFYVLKEDASPCIFGPIEKQRWSYACAKQLIERLTLLCICFIIINHLSPSDIGSFAVFIS